jgi:phosphonate transport system substrate-binding protein
MMRYKALVIAFFSTLFVIIFSWGSQAGKVKPPPVKLAIAAMISPRETFSIYVDLARYLSSKLGRRIEIKHRRTYQEVNHLIRNGEIDFAWLCTGGFLEARYSFGLKALAVPLIQGMPYYHAYIIVPKDSEVEEFSQLRGKTFAFADPLSQTGRNFPVYLLISAGWKVDDFFSNTFFTYSHDRSIEAVAEGLADGASVDSQVYEFLLAMKPDLVSKTRIIMVSQPFGAPPIVASPRVPAELSQRFLEVLLAMGDDPEGMGILQHLQVSSFIVPDENLYREARRVWEIARRGRLRH